MCEAVVSPARRKHRSAVDRGRIGEAQAGDHAGGIVCRGDTAVKLMPFKKRLSLGKLPPLYSAVRAMLPVDLLLLNRV
jgi:hypothetical protein